MDTIELQDIETSDPFHKMVNGDSYAYYQNDEIRGQGHYVDTDFGQVFVWQCGGAKPHSGKPYIITYHDIGLNFQSNFQAFFNFQDMKLLCETFCVLNVHAPGQEDKASPLPNDYQFPTMDQLALQVDSVCKYFGVTGFVGLGVGAGANVLSRYALQFPEQVDGLFLIHPTSTQASWTEWFYQKWNIYQLSATPVQNFGQSMQDYLMWHHFGNVTEDRCRDLIEVYKSYFNGHNHKANNLAMFLNSYLSRTDLQIERTDPEKNFKCSVLVLCGSLSPHVDDTVTMNGRLNPQNSTWMKLSGCGMVLEEQPHKVSEALRLFLQGLGYPLTRIEKYRTQKTITTNGEQNQIQDSSNIHIVENPIANC